MLILQKKSSHPHLFIFSKKCIIMTSLRIVASFFYTFVDGTFTFFKGGKYGSRKKYGSRNYLNGRITL